MKLINVCVILFAILFLLLLSEIASGIANNNLENNLISNEERRGVPEISKKLKGDNDKAQTQKRGLYLPSGTHHKHQSYPSDYGDSGSGISGHSGPGYPYGPASPVRPYLHQHDFIDGYPSSSGHGTGYGHGSYGHHSTGHGSYGPTTSYDHPTGHGESHGILGHPVHGALALKGLLIPLAGIALLGAAAALSTNPVLLQLGVVNGRRRRSIRGNYLDSVYPASDAVKPNDQQ